MHRTRHARRIIPEEQGGIGMGLVAAVAISEEIGRHAWASPHPIRYSPHSCSSTANQTLQGATCPKQRLVELASP